MLPELKQGSCGIQRRKQASSAQEWEERQVEEVLASSAL